MNPIRELKQDIMAEWCSKVRSKIPIAAEQSQLALNDSLPEFLDDLASILDQKTSHLERKSDESHRELVGKVHAQHRVNASYAIDQMIDEYFILKCVIQSKLKSLGTIDPGCIEEVCEAIEKSIQISAAQFSRSLIESQESFVMGLTHDLRSPLMVIKLQADTLKRGSEEKLKRVSERIGKSVSKIDKMIEDLLTSIRSQNHGMAYLEVCEVDMDRIIRSVVNDYTEGHEFDLRYSGQPRPGKWNEVYISRVLDNLISNAFKYGDPTRPVEVTLDGDERVTHISVHNYGPPIPPVELKSIFDRFKRSENSVKQKGWGIGLSLVKAVVEAHKGTVLVTSDESGTTFKLELPTRPLEVSPAT